MSTSNEVIKIIGHIEPFFCKPYQKDPKCKVNLIMSDKIYTIYRPNHSLLHGVRQGMLALRIVDLLTKYATPSSAIHDLNKLPDFRYKLQCSASFMRSGRSSERHKSDHDDAQNFLSVYPNDQMYANAMIANLTSNCNATILISKILQAAHQLDLRRIISFSHVRIKGEILKILFNGVQNKKRLEIIDVLWSYSGRLLYLTGDRDMMYNIQNYSNNFVYYYINRRELASAIINIQ